MSASLAERFFRHVDKGPDCWLWTAALYPGGYGLINVEQQGKRYRAYGAHRLSYELHVGPVPEGMDLDHLCRVRHCVNPSHLEPVTRRENLLRSPIAPAGINARKTHCLRGHPFDEANTYWSGDGRRQCRECRRLRKQASPLLPPTSESA